MGLIISKTIFIMISIFISAYILMCFFIFLYQEKLVFRPSFKIEGNPMDKSLRFEEVWITTEDFHEINGWFVPNESGEKTVIFFHGNGGNISHRLNTLEILHQMGHSVFIIDYRGYGKSSGKPSEYGLKMDARAAWNYLVNTVKIDRKNIVLYGRSLGGAVAIWLASQVTPSALVVESSFSSLIDMAEDRYSFLPTKLLLRIYFDSETDIQRVTCPTFVAHSPSDETVPYGFGKKLAKSSPTLKEFFTLTGSHNDTFFVSGLNYHKRLDSFIRGKL